MNLTISQNIFNSNYRNTVKKENQKKSNQTSAISKNQSFQICSKQASQALKNNISFGRPQIPTLDTESTIEYLYNSVVRKQIIPATAKIQNKYKQELIRNLRTFNNSGYDDMSIEDNTNNRLFLKSNNFAKVEQPGRDAFQIFAYPKEDKEYVRGVDIGKERQRLENVGFVCFDFVEHNGESMLNSYSIKSKEDSYLSGLKVKIEDEDPEREYKVYRVTDLRFINFLNEIDITTAEAAVATGTAAETANVARVAKTAEAAMVARIAAANAAEANAAVDDVAIDILMATNNNFVNGEPGTVSINGANVDVLSIDNDLNVSCAL